MTRAGQPKRRRSRPRLWLAGLAAAVLVTAGLITGLAIGSRTGSGSGAGRAADVGRAVATPSASTRAAVPGSPGPTARPSARSPARRRDRDPARPPAADPRQSTPAGAPLAGALRPGVTYRGYSTFFNAGDGDGMCRLGAVPGVLVAAMNRPTYDTARACGAYLLVRAANGASVVVLVTNRCGPCGPGHIDLSEQAFARLASPDRGKIPVTWRLLSPAMTRTISIRYDSGSSRSWCGIQVIGHRNPVALLAVRVGGGWRNLPRAPDNYFISKGGGCGGPIRITDIYGQHLTIYGIALRPDVAQPTRVQFARH
jgi:expansin (peptidoglycan-binding protein)